MVSTSVVFLIILIALNSVHVALVDHMTNAHIGKHDNSNDKEDLGALVESSPVVMSLFIVFLDVLKELNGVFGMVESLLLNDTLHVLLMLFVAAATVMSTTVASEFESLHSLTKK